MKLRGGTQTEGNTRLWTRRRAVAAVASLAASSFGALPLRRGAAAAGVSWSSEESDLRVPRPIDGKAYRIVKNWDFGTEPGKTIRDHRRLWREFNPGIHYDPKGRRSIYGGWERYRGLEKNYVFTPGFLSLVADVSAERGFQDGGIDGAGLFSWGKFTFRYGYVEMRVRMPPFEKHGLWPAGWLIPDDSTNGDVVEIDLFEVYNKHDAPKDHKNNVFITIHGSRAANSPTWKSPRFVSWGKRREHDNFGGGRFDASPRDIYGAFHTYSVEWTPEEATFYFDDEKVVQWRFEWRRRDGSLARPAYVLLNMSCGGRYLGWPVRAADFPASLDVEYVRVWQQEPR